VTVELFDQNFQHLQNATSEETLLWNTYDVTESIPFVDFADEYAQVGAQYQPSVIAAADWTQIASQLNNASSAYALSIDGAANRLISVICKIDGGAPTSLCSQSFAETLSYTNSSPSGGSQLLISDAILRGQPPSAVATRFALVKVGYRI